MKRRRLEPTDDLLLRVPFERGWRRETLVTGVSRTGGVRGEVAYLSPDGRRFKQYPDVLKVALSVLDD